MKGRVVREDRYGVSDEDLRILHDKSMREDWYLVLPRPVQHTPDISFTLCKDAALAEVKEMPGCPKGVSAYKVWLWNDVKFDLTVYTKCPILQP